MKLKSIVLIIVGVALMLCGIATCIVADGIAARDGVLLYSDDADRDGNRVFYYDYSKDELTKISFALKGAEVNIVPGNEQKIEFVNFTEGSYSRSVTNRALTVSDKLGIPELIKSGDVDISFNGFRHFIHDAGKMFAKKVVNVYIIEDNALNSIEVSLDAGAVRISDIATNGDITVSVGAGSIDFVNVNSASAVTLSGGSYSARLSGGYIRKLICEADAADITADAVDFLHCEIKIDSGKTVMTLANKLVDSDMSLHGSSVSCYGNIVASTQPDASKPLSVAVAQGSVEIK